MSKMFLLKGYYVSWDKKRQVVLRNLIKKHEKRLLLLSLTRNKGKTSWDAYSWAQGTSGAARKNIGREKLTSH